MRCQNCMYWTRFKESYENKEYGDCNNDKFNYEYPAKNKDDNLVYRDGEGWSAGFETGQNFGCIHFKVR